MKQNIIISTIALLALSTAPALAVSKNVSSPNVTKDKIKLENKGAYEFDDDGDEWKHKTELEYGLTDDLQIKIEAEIEKEEGNSVKHDATEIGFKYQLLDGKVDPVGLSVDASYELSHQGGSDGIGMGMNIQKLYNKWDHRINFGLGHDTGEDSESGVSADVKLGSYYKFDRYKVGGEYYVDFGNLRDSNDFEEQEHHIGPVVGFDLPLGREMALETKVGYLVGLSEASADHVVKYEFEYEF